MRDTVNDAVDYVKEKGITWKKDILPQYIECLFHDKMGSERNPNFEEVEPLVPPQYEKFYLLEGGDPQKIFKEKSYVKISILSEMILSM